MTSVALKVGELARQTGISVRTLHHYDEIGLLTPTCRSEAGYRLYTTGDVVRLQHILALRYLGLGLDEIRICLTHPDYSLVRVLHQHIRQIREQIEVQQKLCEQLEVIAIHLEQTDFGSVTDVTQLVEVMKAMEHYFTPEMMAELAERRTRLGDERIQQVEAEWPVPIAEVRAAIANGIGPDSPTAQQLAQRWMGLVHEFTGGNPQIEQTLSQMYQQEPATAQQYGLDDTLFQFIEQAMAAANRNP